MSKSGTLIALSVVCVALFGATVNASAANCGWDHDHCRRVEVNSRLEAQNLRIDHEVYRGQISYARANQLHQEDRHILHEERLMASVDGGHLTRQDQRILNHQENAVSRQISW